jgi:hypothetical protein
VAAGALYFGLVFGAGFIVGFVRVVWIVRWLGERRAELLEVPVMLVVTVVAARWTVRRLAPPRLPIRRLMVGCIALGLLLLVELTFVLWLRGLTFREYVAQRDPVSGTVYVIMLALLAVMPMLVARERAG